MSKLKLKTGKRAIVQITNWPHLMGQIVGIKQKLKTKHPTYEVGCTVPSGYVLVRADDNVLWVHPDDLQTL